MAYHVKDEGQRIPVTIDYIKSIIEDLNREIWECDYEEDPNGNLVYSPNCYAEEKRALESEKRKFETVLDLLTMTPPFFTF